MHFHAFERANERAHDRARGKGEREKRKRDIDGAKEKKKKAREKLFPPFPPGARWSQNPSIKIDDVANLSSELQFHRMYYKLREAIFPGETGREGRTSRVSLMAVGSLLYFCLVQKVHVENYTCEYGTLYYARQAPTETLSRIEHEVNVTFDRSNFSSILQKSF